MSLPPFILGTWQFSGDWLGCYRVIDNKDLKEPLTGNRDVVCPICEYPEAVHLGKYEISYPLDYWCPACELVWRWYAARCPDCDGFVWKKGCKKGKVKCSLCDWEMEQSFVEEVNQDPSFHYTDEEEK